MLINFPKYSVTNTQLIQLNSRTSTIFVMDNAIYIQLLEHDRTLLQLVASFLSLFRGNCITPPVYVI